MASPGRATQHDPLPTPGYLLCPPDVIPIDTGCQLFVDDLLVQETTLRRSFHRAEYYSGNPVLKADRPWEFSDGVGKAMPFSDGVFYDPDAGLYKIWYMGPDCTLHATSRDGVHDPALMRPPDWREFEELQQAAGGNIGIVTLAPEVHGAFDFIRRARSAGIVVGLGHTEASPEQIHQAVEAGAERSTHLGNGCPQLIDRHTNPLWAQLVLDQLSASLICDTFHLPPDLVKTIVRMKRIERCILITDATHVATLPPGSYSLVGTCRWSVLGSNSCRMVK